MACVFLGARLFRPLGSIRLAATAISPVGLNTPPRCAPPPAPAPRGGDGRKLRLDGAESKPHGAGYIKLRLGGAESKLHGAGYIKLRLGGAESKPHGTGMGANCAETAQNPNPT